LPFGFLVVDPFLPPSSLAWLALFALLLFGGRWARGWGRPIAIVLLVPLVIMAMPIVPNTLLLALNVPAASMPPEGPPPGAIVILSADVFRQAEAPGADIGPLTLERERTGAILARRTGLPVLVTGGLVTAPPPVGQMMAASMQNDFDVPVRWVEDKSATTWENAEFSIPMLKAAGITRVYLVTHDWHMRRAMVAFQHFGMDVVPAPVRVEPVPRHTLGEFIPRSSAWGGSYFVMHEWVGLLYYLVRG
jgi:uncharacterized SAM-binding protein YcdF (DUF218 family)